jgi:hypothetical protein
MSLMSFRDDILKRLERKKAEIAKLESDLAVARSYAQALEDTLKLAPRDGMEEQPPEVKPLRPGTALAKAREAILNAGKPLFLSDLLAALGKEDTNANRLSLAGSLGSYVRDRKIFTRPGPNQFGLIELQVPPTQEGDKSALKLVN